MIITNKTVSDATVIILSDNTTPLREKRPSSYYEAFTTHRKTQKVVKEHDLFEKECVVLKKPFNTAAMNQMFSLVCKQPGRISFTENAVFWFNNKLTPIQKQILKESLNEII